MSIPLKANTETTVKIGPFVDVSDGYTPETGITLGGADEAELLKAGTTNTADISGNSFGAITNCDGWYWLTLTSGNLDTEGELIVVIHDDNVCLPVFMRFMVYSEAAYDSMFAAKDTGYMDVNIKTISRTDAQETEANNLESACAAYSATRGLAGTALPDAAADGAGGLPISDAGGLDIDTILGRITGNVALASVVGALADAAADGDPTEAETLMQYIKQLINILIGTAGIAAFPAEAAPANAVSLAEVIRAIHADVTGLNGDAMRGTDSAALASSWTAALATALGNYTAARAGYLDELAAANIPTDVDAIKNKLPSKSYLSGSTDADGGIDSTEVAVIVAAIIAGIADGSYDLQEMIRIIFSVCACKTDGGGTATIHTRDSADSKNRVTVTVDADGNRTASTLDGS